MKLSAQQFEELGDAIAEAFTRDELERLVRLHLGVDLGNIINLDAPFRNIVFDLIDYFNGKGLTEQLIKAVGRERPANSQIRAALEHLGAAVDTAEVERVVRNELPFADIQVWRTRLGELERCVCRVQVGPEDSPEFMATGFLVGPDLVMTCYHGFERLADKSPRIQFSFD